MQPTSTKSGFNYFPMDIAVTRDSSLKGFEKIVYFVICSHANIKTKTTTLSVATIAKEVPCSKRTVQLCIKALLEYGVLARTERFANNRQLSSMYRIIGREAPCYTQPNDANSAEDAEGYISEDAPICTPEGVEIFAPEGAESAHRLKSRFNERENKTHTPLTPQRGNEGEEESLEAEKISGASKPYDTAEQEQNQGSKLYEAIREAYNTILPELPEASNLTRKRRDTLANRIRDNPARRDSDWWQGHFSSVREYPWLMGENSAHWRATFDWLISEDGMQKILEGGFSRRKDASKGCDAAFERQREYADEGGEVNADAARILLGVA